MKLNEWAMAAKWSVLSSLAFGLLYAGVFTTHFLNTGKGSWLLLYKGGINVAGCAAFVVMLLSMFLQWMRLEAGER